MRFKIKNTDIKIGFSFVAIVLLSIVCDNTGICISSVIVTFCHEAVHLCFIFLFKAEITEFSLSFFGGNIKRKSITDTDNFKEALISLSAPVFNIFAGILLRFAVSEKMVLFGNINLLMGVFNILPFCEFDGGRGLYYFLCLKFSSETAEKTVTVTSVLVVTAFSFIACYIFFGYEKNYMMLVISVYMAVLLIAKAR